MEIDYWDVELWAARSRKGEVCGIFGCENKPDTQCPYCQNWYCAEHKNSHYHTKEFVDKAFQEVITAGEKTKELRQDLFREEWNNIIVDTCVSFDMDKWETGISQSQGKHFTIVEQYETRNQAKEGHKKWVQKMKEHPDQRLKDIDLWGLGIKEEDEPSNP